jgi:hypothetical protein
MKQDEMKNKQNESEKDIIYSKTLKAGKRIYYLDVKKNLRNDLFVVITESKRNYSENQTNVTYEKHKIFLYKEDFEKFMNGMNDVIRFISDSTESITDETELSEDENPEEDNL